MAIAEMRSWRCGRCGSSRARLRPDGTQKGCADRHAARERPKLALIHEARQQARDAKLDFEITPAMRSYLAAFDRYLLARRDGDAAAERAAISERHRRLAHLESRIRPKEGPHEQ